ncbi:response regulator [Aquabacterium sp. A7-Y]|uniref:response regulator n=1 Tax=Aquabacterium sp. A7-Y TaxID=1349605 RepID=UPI00223E1BAA|nr:response regulator [Aquabacterium sp. A7-Y]MCW7541978.1 response regulator [Aquabacterium sp. A7-Y]
MTLSIPSRLGLGLVPALLGLLVVGSLSLGRLGAVETDERWVTHTLEVLHSIGETSTQLAETESSARAYRLARSPQLLENYQLSRQRLRSSMEALRLRTLDNWEQQARLNELEPLLQRRMGVLERLLAEAQDQAGTETTRQLQQESFMLSERTRGILEALAASERELLEQRRAQARETGRNTRWLITGTTALTLVIVALGLVVTARAIVVPLRRLQQGALRVGGGDYALQLPESRDELGQVALVFNQMTAQVREREVRLSEEDWIKSALARFLPMFQSQLALHDFCRSAMSELAPLVRAPYAALYICSRKPGRPGLERCVAYGAEDAPQHIEPGQGLVGQCAVEAKVLRLHPVPPGYGLRISSALGAAPPADILVLPAVYEKEVKAVIELGFVEPVEARERDFLERFMGSLAVVLNGLEAREALQEALAESNRLTASLQVKQAELTQSYDELEAQAEELRQSESLLREQQERLQQTNEEYEEANTELRQTSEVLREQAQQLAAASAYKSEFLANMSHELRTPLNSLLILSQLLSENPEGTLSDKQVEYARTIHGAGEDLLSLINDILDLAKIESGTVQVDLEDHTLAELIRSAESTFRAMADAKGLGFETRLDPALPAAVSTDARRLWQIVKNLLANAFKFTEQGRVTFTIAPAEAAPVDDTLPPAERWMAISVRDTGVGIAPEQQQRIFESFHQGDRGTARKYGGTGLGLSISQKLARLLGGVLTVESTLQQGSVFTLYLPLTSARYALAEELSPPAPHGGTGSDTASPASPRVPAAPPAEALPGGVARKGGPPASSRSIIVAHSQAGVVEQVSEVARSHGIEALRLSDLAQISALCQRVWPMMIVLEAAMDEDQGWVALGMLKQNVRTRHVPVHLVCAPGERERALRLGAASAIPSAGLTPALLESVLGVQMERLARPYRTLLVVEDDAVQRQAILDLIGNGDVYATGVGSGQQALDALAGSTFDCVVVDLGLPDMEGADLLTAMHERFGAHCPPVVIYTGRELTRAEEAALKPISEAIIVKGVRSPERLLGETALLLNRQELRLPETKQRMIERGHQEDPVLSGRKVLVVDDDMRNIFATTAALEAYGMTVVHAESGEDGLRQLELEPDVQAVLMDVMMPRMDGYEAMRQLRRLPGLQALPVIAITAKAMPGDRQRCIDAGASDYLTKPVDMDRLRAMLRVLLTGARDE